MHDTISNPLARVLAIVSVDGSEADDRLARRLADSFAAALPDGALVRLWCSAGEPTPLAGALETHVVAPREAGPAGVTGARFRPRALGRWLASTPLAPDVTGVLVLPVDAVIARALPAEPAFAPGLVLTGRDPRLEPKRVPRGVPLWGHDPVGLAYGVHPANLARLAARWAAYVEMLHADARTRDAAGEALEALAYALAARELGLRHAPEPLCSDVGARSSAPIRVGVAATSALEPRPTRPRRGPRVHVAFSVDDSPFLGWQGLLLAHTFSKYGYGDALTRVRSCDAPPTPFAYATHVAPQYFPHPVTGDPYSPYNKPSGFGHWAANAPPDEELVVLLDPDMLWLRPMSPEHFAPVRRGVVVAPHCPYLERNRVPEGFPIGDYNPVGPFYAMHRDDLIRLAPRWLHWTEVCREDPVSRASASWVAEMWGYVKAASELGLEHVVRPTVSELVNPPVGTCAERARDVVHYTLDVHAGDWSWDKRTYVPWTEMHPPPGLCAAVYDFAHELNEFVALNDHVKLW